jgi:4-phytase / acid phosphatase
LWRTRSGNQRFVRVFYVAQSLDQMRQSQPPIDANPPGIAPIFVPGCSGPDLSCTWDGFSAALHQAIDPAYVIQQP